MVEFLEMMTRVWYRVCRMAIRLADNQWGFSVAGNNPFRIFRILQDLARENAGESNIIDLSRGDPGYGFTPGVRGRRFMGYLLFLDTVFNNSSRRVVTDLKEADWDKIWAEVEAVTRTEYGEAAGQRFLDDLTFFLSEVSEMGKLQGLPYSPFKVFYQLFKYASVSGGTYHDPLGEEVVRVIVAWWHQKTLSTPIDYRDVIFVNGASHAIGDLFKLLGKEGIGYLQPHDRTFITSPVYAPYNSILDSRQIEVFSLEIDMLTGKIAPNLIEEMRTYEPAVKLVLLIDPNNPTGFSMDAETLEEIGAFARRKNALVITDEVYSSFFEDKKTMMDICPERTMRINARSKIERSTGLRFGDVVVCKEGQQYIMENLFKGLTFPPEANTWQELFKCGKAPGSIRGEFQHTTFVPGPSQFLGAAHIVLGTEERQAYREAVDGNMQAFVETLGLPHRGNQYYIIFDMDDVPGANKQNVPAEEKLLELAKRGVIYIPSNLFFSVKDRAAKNRENTLRASVVNTSLENIKRAANITKEYLCG